MHLQFQKSHVIPLFLLLINLGGVTYVAYRIVGFLGVGVLGVIIGMISLNVERNGQACLPFLQAAALPRSHAQPTYGARSRGEGFRFDMSRPSA